jgi:hypothetical protein
MSADLEQALKSHGSPAAQLALTLLVMFFWRRATAIYTMDYVKNGLTYDAAQSGLFMGVGVKF